MFLIILLPVCLLLVLLYRKWCQVREYWAVRGVPHSPPHPVFGSLRFLLSENMEPLWSSVRRRLTLVFTPAKLRSLHSLKLQKSKDVVQRIHNLNAENKSVDLRELYGNFATDVLSTAAFGVEGDATLTGQSPMRNITRSFTDYSVKGLIGNAIIFFLPEMHRIVRIPFLPKSATDYFERVFNEVVNQRGGWEIERETKDLLDSLLKMKREAKLDGEEMSDDLLIAQATIFLNAGFDTTAVALTFTTYEIAYRPDVQKKLYNEVYEAKQQLGDKDFDPQTLERLTYLHSVFNGKFQRETLRKYPAMGWLDRVSARNYKVDDNLTIPAGMPVYVNAAAIHYNPEYYPNPDTFDPDRFLPENEGNIRPFTFLAFGEGRRNCIGLRFGRQTMAYAIAHVILNFELKPIPNLPKPSDVKMETKNLFLGPANPLFIEFVPRV